MCYTHVHIKMFLKEGTTMSNITLHKDNGNTTTNVPNRFIDEYMTSANGEFVKIYLYLLRCMNSPDCSFSISETADKFEHTEKDVQRALKYWEKMNLLRLEYDAQQNISSIYFTDTAGAPQMGQPAIQQPVTKTVSSLHTETFSEIPAPTPAPVSELPNRPSMPQYSADDMLRFQEKEDIQELLFVTESYLGHPLNQSDIQILLFWYDELQFSADVIIFLIEHAISKGHKSLRYMNSIALSWSEAQVKTVEDARNNISSYSKIHYAVAKAFGIQNRNLVSIEVDFVNKWTQELGYGLDIISEACKRTILSTHQPNFEYADKILTSWHDQKVCQLTDIVKIDTQHQREKNAAKVQKSNSPNKFNNFHQRTYDYDDLQNQLLNS